MKKLEFNSRMMSFRVWNGKEMLFQKGDFFKSNGIRYSLAQVLNDVEFIPMQSLCFNDINKKEVFEADIVKVKTRDGKEELKGFIIYDAGEYMIEMSDDKFPVCTLSVLDLQTIEVLGNIFSNPELFDEKSIKNNMESNEKLKQNKELLEKNGFYVKVEWEAHPDDYIETNNPQWKPDERYRLAVYTVNWDKVDRWTDVYITVDDHEKVEGQFLAEKDGKFVCHYVLLEDGDLIDDFHESPTCCLAVPPKDEWLNQLSNEEVLNIIKDFKD